MGITELVAVFGGIGALVFAFIAWRRADNASAERLGVIETKLSNILKDLGCLIEKLDNSDNEFKEIRTRLVIVEKDVEKCFEMLERSVQGREENKEDYR